ncbi:MAG: hypothetical protein NTW30_00590, partial [Candidatus Aenigmarchaeota archaeon]|nr:hypothetical protein [Candidatus Aenigmarchaeota archaeon]
MNEMNLKLIYISICLFIIPFLFFPVLSQVTGEGASLDTVYNRIIIGEALNNARDSITSTDLPTLLKSGEVIDDNGVSYPYKQYIELNGNAHVYYSTSGGDLIDPKLLISMSTNPVYPTYTTRVFFSKNIPVNSNNVTFNTIKLFGRDYAIGSGSFYNKLVLYGESNTVTLKEGEEQKVTINGTEYTIKVEGVSGTTIGVISVNGVTKSVTKGNTYNIAGIDVYVSNIYYYSKEAQVSSMKLDLGSQKLTLEDGQEVLFDTTNYVDNTLVKIIGISSTNEISSFKILTSAQDSEKDDIQIGKSYTDPVWKTFKLEFTSTTPALDDLNSDTMLITYSGDRTMTIKFQDYYKNEKTLEFAYNNVSALTSTPTIWLMNSNQYKIIIKEGDPVLYRHYLVVNQGDDTHLLQLTNVPTGQVMPTDTVSFKDVFTGAIYEKTISPYTNCGKGFCNVSMQIGSQMYYVAVYNKTVKTDSYVKVTWNDVTVYPGDTGATYSVPGYISFLPGIKAKNGEYIHFVNSYTKFNYADVVILPTADSSTSPTFKVGSTSTTFKIGQVNYTYDNTKGTIVPTELKNYAVGIMMLEG